VVSAIAILAGVDAFVASRAGAALEPMVPASVVVDPVSAPPVTSTTVPRRRAPTRTKRRAKPAAPAKKPQPAKPPVRPAKPPAPPAQPTLAAWKPPVPPAAPVPTGCAAVVASVVWPAGWNTICAGPRSGLLGLTSPTGTTTLYVRDGESSTFLHTVAVHEAGHAWDFSHLNANKIAQWCAARGCDAAHFFTGGAQGAGWTEPAGAEDWAAAWGACHGGDYHRSYLGLAPPNAALCALQNALVGYPG
jgi:hypothetical protein